jgi:transcriptional regulator
MSRRSKAQESDPSVRELVEIKKLVILDMMSRGIKQSQIAKMLGVDPGNFSRMYPMKGIISKSKNSK